MPCGCVVWLPSSCSARRPCWTGRGARPRYRDGGGPGVDGGCGRRRERRQKPAGRSDQGATVRRAASPATAFRSDGRWCSGDDKGPYAAYGAQAGALAANLVSRFVPAGATAREHLWRGEMAQYAAVIYAPAPTMANHCQRASCWADGSRGCPASVLAWRECVAADGSGLCPRLGLAGGRRLPRSLHIGAVPRRASHDHGRQPRQHRCARTRRRRQSSGRPRLRTHECPVGGPVAEPDLRLGGGTGRRDADGEDRSYAVADLMAGCSARAAAPPDPAPAGGPGQAIDPGQLRQIADLLAADHVPFSVAVYPMYLGPVTQHPRQRFALQARPQVVTAIRYMLAKGGTLVLHGYTHQLGGTRNPNDGESGQDYEFLRSTTTPGTRSSMTAPSARMPWPGQAPHRRGAGRDPRRRPAATQYWQFPDIGPARQPTASRLHVPRPVRTRRLHGRRSDTRTSKTLTEQAPPYLVRDVYGGRCCRKLSVRRRPPCARGGTGLGPGDPGRRRGPEAAVRTTRRSTTTRSSGRDRCAASSPAFVKRATSSLVRVPC